MTAINYAIGVDLGGTNCRLGVVNGDGDIVHQETFAVGSERTHKAIVNLLAKKINEICSTPANGLVAGGAKYEVRGAGVGAPGIIDFGRGTIIRSPHYPAWHNFELRKELSDALGMKVVLDNDANMIANGELWKGAGRGHNNFIMITLGTGIGGGIIADGRVFHGDEGFAGEIGHQVMQFDGQKCDCGGRGCWETIVSINGLKWLAGTSDDPRKDNFLKRFHGDAEKITPKSLFELAGDGDIFAGVVWKKFGAYLGAGIASLVNVLGIHTVVIGGGISHAWDFFIGEAKREIARRTYKETAARVVLKRAELGDAAGIIGAANAVL